uniref:26S proteasome regulatory subunit C-terminal domain-containing protein n=1 Tax=Romanomermis culicivorax TaxID=13658 RepID=A0A915I428_ROMCU
AIKDGVIDAELDKENQFLKSRESGNIYNTPLPQMEFHKRIQFCLDIHTQAVKAMRFPPKSYAKDVETADEKREREQQELEFAKEMAEDDDFS